MAAAVIVEVGALEERWWWKHTIDVKAFVYNALDLGIPPVERRRLVVEAVGEVLDIEADESKLQRAFLSLVHNALKYSPTDTTVRIRTADHLTTGVARALANTAHGLQDLRICASHRHIVLQQMLEPSCLNAMHSAGQISRRTERIQSSFELAQLLPGEWVTAPAWRSRSRFRGQ
jgi:hypothetical protein